MTSRCHGKTHQELVENLKAKDVIKSGRVRDAMLAIDRGYYATQNPYLDQPQQLSNFGVTISAPHMHAHALEQLSGQLKEGARALDIGSGSGYLTSCMAVMVGETGLAVGLEIEESLVQFSLDNLRQDPVGSYMKEAGRIELVVGDGNQGYPAKGPYDAIHVAVAAPKIPPPLLQQLAPGGRLVMPVGPKGGQTFMHVDRSEHGVINQSELMRVNYGMMKSGPAKTQQKLSTGNHIKLVDNLRGKDVIKNELACEAMKSIDRCHYTKGNPYADSPQGIGYNVTISAPHMHAVALESLSSVLKEGARVLDIGSGTGYLTACMAVLVGSSGRAVGIDHINQLIDESIAHINEDPVAKPLLDNGRIQLVVGDGRQGYPPLAPYDAIHLGAAVPEIPQKLIDQLRPGGRMFLPAGPQGNQKIKQVDKRDDGSLNTTDLMGVRYGLLSSKEEQMAR